jgi:L-rhamnose mutarotase
MLEALHESGYRNYSIFIDQSGLLVGYFEADDPQAAIAAMGATEVNARWSALLDDLFVAVDGARPVGTIAPLQLAFDLDSQRGGARI